MSQSKNEKSREDGIKRAAQDCIQ